MILSGLLTIFFLLYFNRLFSSIVSYAIRTWTWHRYRVYIDIQALQISLLGGRIFFTGLRYHGSNETFLVQYGDITWRYWLRRVRDAEVIVDRIKETQKDDDKDTIKNASLPCRINVNLVGMEWFVYNRSPAYESVLAGLKGGSPGTSTATEIAAHAQEAAARLRKTPNASNEKAGAADGSDNAPGNKRHLHGQDLAGLDDEASIENDLPALLDFFPIHIECQKPAVVVGNENTKGILIVKSDTISCDIDASTAKTCDPYRQLFNLTLKHPIVEIRDNEDYREDQAIRASKEREPVVPKSALPRRTLFRHRRRRVLHSLRNMVPYWRRSVESFSTDSRGELGTSASHHVGTAQWQGLSRYLEDRDQDDKARWATVEYGAENIILDSPSAQFTMYWDSVGKVSRRNQECDQSPPDSLQHINGSDAPGWGMHFVIHGGVVNYGPWADRHRAELQRVFVPNLCKDAVPAQPVEEGEWRVATQFKIFIEMVDTLTMRIPIKEESKNWRWRGKEPAVNQQTVKNKKRQRNKKRGKTDTSQTRPAGWLELKVPANATVDYAMDMMARTTGYRNTLLVDLPNSELWSSVNHDILWRSGPQKISCNLSNPLAWNTLRNWHFDVASDNMKLYLLRDHIFLLTDLVNDWASGPPSDYMTFTPYNYHLDLDLHNVELLLNVNDGNIIDNPTSLEENSFLIISSPRLTVGTTIALDKFRPEKSSIPFDIRCDTLDASLNPSQSNTEAAFLSTHDIGHAESLAVTGSYHYNATTSSANTDTLILNLHGQSPCAYVYGFLIRYALLLKDNYFGDHVHFRTLDEYQELLQSQSPGKDITTTSRPPPKKSNDMDIMLSVKVDDAQLLVPTSLYSTTRVLVGELASLSVDVRFTNYYMDLELDLSPLSLSHGTTSGPLASPDIVATSTQLYVDGIRVFGHRAFGLPPTEPTYLCNWDLSVGEVKGDCDGDFLSALTKGAEAFVFTFDDVENALVPYSSLIFYDITFIRATVASICIWVKSAEGAFLLTTDSISVTANDWARSHYSKKANIDVPNLQLSCVDLETASKHTLRETKPVKTEAFFRTDIRLATVGRKVGFTAERKLQQELVRREDQRTDRTPFLLLNGVMDEFQPEPTDLPAQCAPPQPFPVSFDDDDSISDFERAASEQMRSKSSFLSLSSATEGSIRRTQSYVSYQSGSMINPAMRPPRQVGLGQDHSTVTFSSPYFPPHFNLENVSPEVPVDSLFKQPSTLLPEPSTSLDAVDPNSIDEEYIYSSTMIEFPNGATAFFNPQTIRHAVSVLESIQPDNPEDILDSIQTSTLSEIFGAKKHLSSRGTIKDVLLRLPKADVRFINSTSDSQDRNNVAIDRYDLAINSVDLVARTKTDSREYGVKLPLEKSHTSLQLRVDYIEASAGQYTMDEKTRQTALMARINNVLVSRGVKDVTYLDVDIGSVFGSTASGDIEYLATLIHRSGNIASELRMLLSETSERQSNRIKYCCCRLLEVGSATNDPSFLIRPSAVLRSVDQHLRTVDSWKLMMRLRQIWTVLDKKERIQFVRRCASKSPPLPQNANRFAVDAFKKWRSWDLEDIEHALLLTKIFGKGSRGASTTIPDEQPLLAACRLGRFQLTLDPGPRENKIALLELNARLETKDDGLIPGLFGGTPISKPLTVANISMQDISVNLNWELYELLEIVLRLSQGSQTLKSSLKKTRQQKPAPDSKTDPDPGYSASHVFLDITKVSVDLEAINLRARTMLDGFKVSAILSKDIDKSSFNTVLVNCGGVTSRLHSRAQLLWMLQLRQPSISAIQQSQEANKEVIHMIKASASTKQLSFSVKQDVTTLLDVVDSIIKDEVSQLYRLKEHEYLQQKKSPVPLASPSKLPTKIKLDIVMMLGRYTITVPLLQSLTYKISGVIARAGCVADIGNEIIFDFDLKENIHEMQINVNDTPRSICIVDIPPTNGRITSHMRDDQHVLTVLSSVEVVKLDASSLYSLLAALNRPQVSDEIKDIQNQAKIIQEHMSDLDGSDSRVTTQATTRKVPTTSVLYDVHFTLAGLHTLAKTSSIKTGSGEYAQLLFSLGTLHIQASNKTTTPGLVLKYPEVHLDLRYIGFDVRRCEGSSTRSCGSLGARVSVYAGSHRGEDGKEKWTFNFLTDDLDVNLSPQTVSTFVEVVGYLGAKIKHLDTSRELDYLKKLGQSKPRISITSDEGVAEEEDADILDSVLAAVTYRFQLRDIKVCWNVAEENTKDSSKEDLALSIKLIEFGTRTNKSARLTIDSFQLQMVEPGEERGARSLHSALLPELTFNVAYLSTTNARRLAFQAVGKSLDLRLTPKFIVPAAYLIESISLSAKNVQAASSKWTVEGTTVKPSVAEEQAKPSQPLLGKKRLESLLIDADFAGAVVTIMGKRQSTDVKATSSTKSALPGKYGQFDTADTSNNATLRSPGLAWKAEYRDNGKDDPSLQGEVLVDASSNILYPAVVPLVLDIVSSVKEVVSKTNKDKGDSVPKKPAELKTEKSTEEESILNVDPEAVIGKLKLNLGLRIARQEFTLSCQPIARVAATTSFESFYFTLNTIASQEQGNFLAISGILNKPQASVQHVYSRDSTASFALDTVTLSFMNSKHVSGISGVSAILNVSPMKISVNARQAQDFLLFREIWYPEELRYQDMAPVAKMHTETSQSHLVQRYQQVAATAAFPWTATISIAALDVNVDLGQAIGKASFQIQNFWVSSKKTSDWEQNLCLGFDKIGIDCTGRLSGFIALQRFQMRTSIQWPKRQEALNETPLVQASLVFNALQVKAAFDYQAFLVADIRKLEFLMYNVRESGDGSGDRLVAIFNGDAVQIFGTTTSAAQVVSVYQAVQKLMQENQENFESSLKEIEKFMSRKSMAGRVTPQPRRGIPKLPEDDTLAKSPISLDTDVVVTLKALNLGVFPSTFSDHQVFKMEALNAYARFAASVEDRRVHTLLRMTLGQLRIGLAGVRNAEAPRTLSEMRVEDVVERSTGARGGTILKVPRVEAVMETWQAPKTNQIEYKFKSAFEGKVEVGWNYSRVSYIRGMWANHNKMLEQTWGKQLPMTAVKITGVPKAESDSAGGEQGKITAEVNVPQSKYSYTAMEAPIIETPQLRDMGEATPPLEWIGLNRDRLPNLTHQIVIVSLLELAGEVEEAYSRILGSS